jgi:hypothetical protein
MPAGPAVGPRERDIGPGSLIAALGLPLVVPGSLKDGRALYRHEGQG